LIGFGEESKILMLNHVYHPTASWGLPGGWLDKDEAPAECALRELKEETGLSAILGPVVLVTHEVIPPHIGIAYMAKIKPGEIQLSSEIISAAWFNPDDLPEPILSFTRDAIKAAVSYPNQNFAQKREWDE